MTLALIGIGIWMRFASAAGVEQASLERGAPHATGLLPWGSCWVQGEVAAAEAAAAPPRGRRVAGFS